VVKYRKRSEILNNKKWDQFNFGKNGKLTKLMRQRIT